MVKKGDLIATLQIRLPEEISESDRELISKLDGEWIDVEARSKIVW